MKNMSNNKPPVSVIMPVYNAGRYLRASIESMLKQTYQNFEFIIVNDASSDNSLEIINQYKKRYPAKIKVITLAKNLNRGGDSCANLAIQHAKGAYICRMDADDVSHPERIEKQVAFLEKNKDYFLVGSNAYVINADGDTVGTKIEPTSYEDIYKSYFTFHPLIHPSCMYRRIINGKIFQYSIKYSANNDYYTFFQLICSGHKFANLKDKLLYYRIHGKNDTFVHIKRKFINTLRIRYTMVRHFSYAPTVKQLVVTVLQAGVALLLPEKVTAMIYFVTKGIVKIHNPFQNLIALMKIRVSVQ